MSHDSNGSASGHSRQLEGRVAVVTGGGRGIGEAVVRQFSREGARVAIADIDPATASEVATSLGEGTLAAPVDVTDRLAFTAFLDEVEGTLGAIDILVNNAGVISIGPIEHEDDASTERQLATNLHAVIHGTREAVRRMRPSGRGHIVNVASAAAKTGVPHVATYCATKHGVLGFSDAVRRELRGSGVKISVVLPALVRTQMFAGLKPARGFRPSAPDDVAAAIVATLRTPRFEVYVPRLLGAAMALPHRAREALLRVARIEEILTGADRAGRAAYEAELENVRALR